MNDDFLSIKDAAERTNKSADSIRRMLKSLLLAEPNTPHIKQEQLANGSTKYYISTSYLADHLAPTQKIHVAPKLTQPDMQPEMQGTTQLTEIIQLLRQQLDEKDRQIAKFQEDAHEKNVLLGNLQQQLLLEAPHKPEQQQQPETTKQHRFLWFKR